MSSKPPNFTRGSQTDFQNLQDLVNLKVRRASEIPGLKKYQSHFQRLRSRPKIDMLAAIQADLRTSIPPEH
jgi:hypothetical protein